MLQCVSVAFGAASERRFWSCLGLATKEICAGQTSSWCLVHVLFERCPLLSFPFGGGAGDQSQASYMPGEFSTTESLSSLLPSFCSAGD